MDRATIDYQFKINVSVNKMQSEHKEVYENDINCCSHICLQLWWLTCSHVKQLFVYMYI